AVILPAALADLDDATVAAWATQISVPDAELRTIVGGPEPSISAGGPRQRRTSAESKAPSPPSKSRAGRRTAMGWELPLAVVAVLGLAVGGYNLFGSACGKPAFESFQADFGAIPVKHVKKL